MVTLALFLRNLESNPLFFISVVVTVIVSITLHELCHGLAAIALGDDTPIVQNRMTLNPLVHMGVPSIIMMLVVGIAWGMMPINPSKLRGRHAGAWVALAGPMCNLVLALAAGAGLGLWLRYGGSADSQIVLNWQNFLFYFTLINVVLMIFNLLPVPPLDGSHIVSSFVPAYRHMMAQVNPLIPLAVVFGLVIVAGRAGYGLFDAAAYLTNAYLQLIRG